ncbi:DUF2059 domain-containing protein [Allomesorhizobium camelthorni]|uniref:DUF2059 domain-containing protein n=1 Tax=Allomesorhizobium camelthorni TaxID=475069 RepID=A0A6G4WMD3_9HYPH|nr:DUF2059 domain-containing protein [Mesorhizobium camelthorni]NGO55227.1 DUF2059 domain-containing protein [Mesorhizobium camelthorni]
MTLVHRVRRLSTALAASVIVATASPVFAQEISDAHLQAAREAVDAINATDMFDGILPAAAAALKSTLIEKNPDLQELITATVDQKALEMAGRRADLEKEAGLAYARVFPVEDLNAIAAFYNSPAGKKLLADGPIVTREVTKAADIWQRGIVRDLAEVVGKSLKEEADRRAKAAPATEGAAPAPEGEAPAAAN